MINDLIYIKSRFKRDFKNSLQSIGTCFLFHCGMPDDFRCKFTAHTNYSSGILTVSRNELQSSLNSQASKPKLSQNELDLANLKRPYHM